jgi:hypothetical protein
LGGKLQAADLNLDPIQLGLRKPVNIEWFSGLPIVGTRAIKRYFHGSRSDSRQVEMFPSTFRQQMPRQIFLVQSLGNNDD